MTDILQLLIYGLVLGSVLTMGAIGVSMIFGILRFAHFAHGDFMTLGAYLGLSFISAFGLSSWWQLLARLSAVLTKRSIQRSTRER